MHRLLGGALIQRDGSCRRGNCDGNAPYGDVGHAAGLAPFFSHTFVIDGPTGA